ncbi:MAG: CTP synthetase, CTP synthase [Parcubacteria group bacterium GW2011_GWC1_40_13]|nr:MAG: CTP synthetase, CTP synthase [Parcubacteria group bacterium GW2011_GWC1_40_13]
MSGVGKGIATSSIGKILQSKNYKVNPIKVDPYLNVDAGTMNPTEHGEVFVLDSGLECDQDLGNYERFMDIDLKPDNYMTSGMVYQYVIEKERNLGYKGKCVEAIPHITGEITRRIQKSAEMSGADISIIEIGGTVGDYQNIMFIEAARTLKLKNPDDVIFVLVSYLPIPSTLGEMKTRPTQNAVRNLNSYGVQPEIIIARGAAPLDERRKEKIAVSCNIAVENVVSAPDVESVYDVPINFEKDNLSGIILKTLKLKKKSEEDMKEWRAFADRVKSSKEEVNIAVIGKYFDTGDFVLSDAYISVIEAAKYSAYSLGKKLKLTWLNSKDLESGDKEVSMLGDFDGVIVPGGFGESGIEGKLKAIKFVRENKIPYLGLCYGMQLAVIEYARNVLGLKDANTTEIDPNSKNPVIDIMFNQKKNMEDGRYGGTMRLGAYKAVLEKDTIARAAYGEDEVWERHRHRYEVNSDYIKKIESAGMIFSGKSPNGTLMEIAELPKSAHPFFLGTQFHPEFKARPLHPHPLFTEFMKVAIARKKK